MEYPQSRTKYGYLAQLVEQFAYNEKVGGSSPPVPSKRENSWVHTKKAGVVELVDTPGLGPGASGHAGSNPATRILTLTTRKKTEKWLSGLKHWFAKSAYIMILYHGFESHFLRLFL